MVHGEQQNMIVFREPQEFRTQKGSSHEIEGLSKFFPNMQLNRRFSLARLQARRDG